MNISETHVLVTGGGTGIGLAIAQTLAKQGAQVTITGRRVEKLQAAAKTCAGLYPAVMDVTDGDAVSRGVADAVTARGPIGICVANAGLAEGRSLGKTTPDFWRQIMSTNLDGAYLTIRACLPAMLEVGAGRVIAVSSIAGLKGLKGACAYTASKHGLIGLIRGLAEDHVTSGVTFNALCPAYVDTDIVTYNLARLRDRGMTDEAAQKVIIGANPHGRLIAPDEVAQAALWLCGPGSDSVNGQAIQIAGGNF